MFNVLCFYIIGQIPQLLIVKILDEYANSLTTYQKSNLFNCVYCGEKKLSQYSLLPIY